MALLTSERVRCAAAGEEQQQRGERRKGQEAAACFSQAVVRPVCTCMCAQGHCEVSSPFYCGASTVAPFHHAGYSSGSSQVHFERGLQLAQQPPPLGEDDVAEARMGLAESLQVCGADRCGVGVRAEAEWDWVWASGLVASTPQAGGLALVEARGSGHSSTWSRRGAREARAGATSPHAWPAGCRRDSIRYSL